MRGYSRVKQEQAQAELLQKQQEFELKVAQSRQRQMAIVRETEHLRKMHQLAEARKRLQEVQRVQEDQLKRKDFRDKYVQAMRVQDQHTTSLPRTESRERAVQALDLEVNTSRIPRLTQGRELPHMNLPGGSKIPVIRRPQKVEEALWTKGDLLDSLDLSSTKLKEKLGQFQEKLKAIPQAEEKPEAENGGAWLRQSIKQSIKEWAPVLSENRAAIETKPKLSTKPPITTPQKADQDPVKPSKKVSEIRGRVQRNRAEDGFLSEELHCLEEEEKRMLESIDRLDAELIGIQQIDHQIDYTSKPRPKNVSLVQEESLVEQSVAKLSEILERRSEAGTDVGSVYGGPGSVCSAPVIGPTTRIKKRMLTKVTIEDLKRERTHSHESARREEITKPSSYAGIKAKEKAPSAIGRPPVPRLKTVFRVEVNPRVDLKAIFEDDDQDLPPWAD